MSFDIHIPAQFEKRKKNHAIQNATCREMRQGRLSEYMKEFRFMCGEFTGQAPAGLYNSDCLALSEGGVSRRKKNSVAA